MKGIQAVPEIIAGFAILIVGLIIIVHRIFQALPEEGQETIFWIVTIFIGVILVIVGALVINHSSNKLK